MRTAGWLILLFFTVSCSPALATEVCSLNKTAPAYGHDLFQIKPITDSLPKTIDDTIVVPFEYKQSSLNYRSTFKLIDSAIQILLANDSITFSIDGYSYVEEATENICYWLSFNRALSVKNYVLGQGIDSTRLIAFNGRGNQRSIHRKIKRLPVKYNYTAEIILNYPIPPPAVKIPDMDEDGIPDEQDSCRSEYGYADLKGCPDRNAIIVPFELQLSSLFSMTYKVLDSVVVILQNNPLLSIAIEGHACKKEGVKSVCYRLAKERADIAKNYLLSRLINPSRIESVNCFSYLHPLNAGRNPWEISRNARAEIRLVHH
jgi:outer membrane protein OmpA-like peptidoglycan-associated protein